MRKKESLESEKNSMLKPLRFNTNFAWKYFNVENYKN